MGDAELTDPEERAKPFEKLSSLNPG